ncbi:hypothetical protein [Actinomyces sp.]|uniref:hypothetical protein n=1 Tax=Actinomyces sp. TaxID=29317 RepID=UPI0029094969|nr:hypothetical protein [Actinomyces sp.]MDU7239813.1 hypothetical protein [Actinomyces sp.]
MFLFLCFGFARVCLFRLCFCFAVLVYFCWVFFLWSLFLLRSVLLSLFVFLLGFLFVAVVVEPLEVVGVVVVSGGDVVAFVALAVALGVVVGGLAFSAGAPRYLLA